MNFKSFSSITLFFFFTVALTAQIDLNKTEVGFNSNIDELDLLDIIKQSENENWVNKNLSGLSAFDDDLLIARRADAIENNEITRSDSLTFQYDENNNAISILTLRHDFPNWNNSRKTTVEFDNNSNRLLSTTQNWLNDEWVNSSEFYYEYNNQNQETLRRIRIWSEDEWSNLIQWIRTYDDSDRALELIAQMPNGTTWDNDTKDTYVYNEQDQQIETTEELWFGGQLLLTANTSFSYDAMGNIIKTETSTVQMTGFLPARKRIYEYDDQQNQILLTDLSFEDGEYLNRAKVENTFNSLNLLTQSMSSEWQNNAWLPTVLLENTFDERENRVYNQFQYWSDLTSQWETTSQNFYYYQFSSSTDEFLSNNLNFNISPNPNNGIFDLNMHDQLTGKAQIKIYTPEGKMVEQFIVHGDTRTSSFNLSHLKQGNYILSITSKQGTGSQKIIIVR